jgi:Mg2+ and Co2+ transporter CorA
MNFFAPSAPSSVWTSAQALLAILVMMALIPIAMYLWVRRKGWM